MATPSSDNKQQLSTLALQDTLPHLPVPSLSDTFNQLAITKANVADFLKQGGLGEKLQRRLVEVAARETTNHGNWIDAWWLRLAYHQWREPILVNSNWYMLFRDDPTLLKAIQAGQCDIKGVSTHNYSAGQVKRAVSILQAWLDTRDALNAGQFPIDSTRNGPQCMHQYYQLFGVTRVPKPGCDTLRGGGENYHDSAANDILLMLRNQAYRVPVYTEDNKRLSDADIEYQIWRAINDVNTRQSLDEPVCLFTGDHRDLWADAHQKLIDLSDVNVKTLQAIEDCVLAVSLDDFAPSGADIPDNKDETILLSFRNGLCNPNNRWLDKSLSIVVERNARAGLNGEHSPCDALIASILGEATVKRPIAYFGPTPTTPSATKLAAPEALHFVLDNELKTMLNETRQRVEAVENNSDPNVLHFREYGTDTVKRVAKVSPDAFMQMALQLTYYTLHHKFAPTYETASTRAYLKGRTETVRTLSTDSRAWCEAMRNKNASNDVRYRLLQTACKAHVDYLKIASKGHGCDRHMLGLRMVLRNGEQHAVFTDDAFGASQTWRLSTSGLTTGDLLLACGFGAVVEDGYGINYQARPKALQFGMESKKSCLETNTAQFRETLIQVLREMYGLCVSINGNDGQKAKI
ncbi:acyltransferase ChoActase/COT/CPT [Syncephalis fuscata]|nr:acyltransferase ChoActase/COT/CPT [Syncephalis fuscata]